MTKTQLNEEEQKALRRSEGAKKAAETRRKNRAKKAKTTQGDEPVNKYRNLNVGQLVDAKKALVEDMKLIDEVLMEVQQALGVPTAVTQVPAITKGTQAPNTQTNINNDIFGTPTTQPGLNTNGMPAQPQIYQGTAPLSMQPQTLSQPLEQSNLGVVTNPQATAANVQNMMKQGNINPIISMVDAETEAKNVKTNISSMVENYKQVSTPNIPEIGSTPVVPQAVEAPQVAPVPVTTVETTEPVGTTKVETAAPKVMPATGVTSESLQVEVPTVDFDAIVKSAAATVKQSIPANAVVTPASPIPTVTPPASPTQTDLNSPVSTEALELAQKAGATQVISNQQDIATTKNSPDTFELAGQETFNLGEQAQTPEVERVPEENINMILEAPFPAGNDDD